MDTAPAPHARRTARRGAAATRTALATALALLCAAAAPPARGACGDAGAAAGAEAELLVRQAFARDAVLRRGALRRIEMRDGSDVVAGLIQGLRFVPARDGAVQDTLARLTGADPGSGWFAWMLWQQEHPEIVPFCGFDAFKADLMALIDPAFREFLYPGVAHEIRLEEIVWGGVGKDGIPALVDPQHIAAREAAYLDDDELVFGVAVNGDARAYPLRIMDWHEMFNDVVGGVPVALAYCTLCGAGILFETLPAGREERFVFGSSGFLYRSNKLMYDHGTRSLWNQFTGRPVVGPLTGSGIELRILPVAIASWADWRGRHPETRVLSPDTGHVRDYTPGRPYGAYFASPNLMFPAVVADDRLAPKDYVFALRPGPGLPPKAWPLSAFAGGAVINDRTGDTGVVLVGNAETRTVRAYASDGLTFAAAGDGLIADGTGWTETEDALVADDGRRLGRLPGHVAYWFAWSGYLPEAELAR